MDEILNLTESVSEGFYYLLIIRSIKDINMTGNSSKSYKFRNINTIIKLVKLLQELQDVEGGKSPSRNEKFTISKSKSFRL